MELGAAAQELYGLAPEEFVAARTSMVKQAKQAGDKALATEIGALRKPTRTAWLVNALARADPDAVGGLLDLGDRLRTAQEARDSSALRELSAQRRSAIDALVRRARTVGTTAGHPPTDSTLNEVAQTLQAALGEPEVGEHVRAGRLAGGAVYGGFGGVAESAGADDLAAMLAASMPSKPGNHVDPAPDAGDARARQEAEQRRAALRQAWDDARAAADEAQDDADRATEEADRHADDVDRLTGELAAAEQAERRARTAAKTARDTVRTRRDEADRAESAWREAED